jgi:hypothetical protein
MDHGDGLGMLGDGVLSTLSEVDIAHAALDLFAGAVFVGGSWFAAADMHRVRAQSAVQEVLERARIAAARRGRGAAPPPRT